MSMGGGQQQGAPQLTQSNTAGNTSQQGTTTTNTGPWAPQQSYLQGGFANAANLANTNNQLPISPLLQTSFGDMTTAAQNAAPNYLQPAQGYNNSVLSGQYLSPNSNPYLAQSVQAAMQPIMNNYQTAIAPGVASNSEMANRYGSGSANQQMNQAQTALATTLGNTSANMYSGAYNQGIQQQEQAAAQAPGMLQASLMPSQFENQAGQQQQQLMQAQQQYPWLTAQMYQGIVGGNYGQSGTTQQNQTGTSQGTMTGQQQQPYYSNPAGSIFGGALSALGTAGALGFAPFTGGASLAALPAAQTAARAAYNTG